MIAQIAAVAGTLFSDPLSGWLLLGDVVATFLVGLGIVLEAPEKPNCREKVAIALVIVGVIAETVCSVWLFAHDSVVVQKQQGRIIALQGEGNDLRAENTELRMKQRSRIILDRKCFSAKLAHKPRLSADVVYTRDDSEAYMFALQIVLVLGERGARWNVDRPRPLAESDALPLDARSGLPPDAPLELRAGASMSGMALVVRTIPHEYPLPSPSNGPLIALNWAFLNCAHEGGELVEDPRMPPDVVRIVVARKSARQL